MITTIADTTCMVLVEAYRMVMDGTIGSQLVSTGALTMNALAVNPKDFIIATATLNPGDTLDVRVSITCTDSATGTVVIPAIWGIELQADLVL